MKIFLEKNYVTCCISQGSPENRERQGEKETEREIEIQRKREDWDYRQFFIQLWRLGNPTICYLQARELGKPLVIIQSNSKDLRIRGLLVYVPVCVQTPKKIQRQENMDVSAQVERANLHFFCLSVFCLLFSTSTDWMMPTHNG